MNQNTRIGIVAGIVVLIIGGVGYALSHNSFGDSVVSSQTNAMGTLQVVAGENFWGSIASQIGGTHVHVTSIVSDPNADPHEYESNTTDARLFSSANYVILNGAGYDSWGDKLLSAGTPGVNGSTTNNRKVLDVATLLGKKEGDNPHLWYNPTYVNTVAKQIETDYISLDPANTAYYQEQYATLQTAFAEYQNRITAIKQQFGGTKVAATEDIFAYLATASGLDLISPTAFTEAVAEGNDPPAASVVTFQNQLKSGQVKVLVYNEQTVTPLTESMKALAAQQNIPVVGITETIQPPDATFQEWMNAELLTLQNALNAQKLGQ
jgi:zinc/manganese transport system substrate-binding protein